MFLHSLIIFVFTVVFSILSPIQSEVVLQTIWFTRTDCETQVIVVGNITIAACNVGAKLAGTWVLSYGRYFQRDDWSISSNDQVWWIIDINKQWPCPEGFHIPSATERGNLITARYTENRDKVKYYGEAENWLPYLDFDGNMEAFFAFQNDLLLPLAGMYNYNPPANFYGQEEMGNYWSVSPYDQYIYSLGFNTQGVYTSSYNDRIMGASIRCFQS
jgi:uncharacterized protein (TIGR02145 family)